MTQNNTHYSDLHEHMFGVGKVDAYLEMLEYLEMFEKKYGAANNEFKKFLETKVDRMTDSDDSEAGLYVRK